MKFTLLDLVVTLVITLIIQEYISRSSRMRWLDDISNSMDMGLGGLCELVMERKAWCAVLHGVTKNQTQLTN